MPVNPTEAQQEASRLNGKRGGRKPEEKEPLTRIEIKLSADEKKQIQEASKSCDLTVSEYMRRRALGLKLVSKLDQKNMQELRRLSGLLKHIHTESNGAYSAQTEHMLSDIHSIIQQMVKDDEVMF